MPRIVCLIALLFFAAGGAGSAWAEECALHAAGTSATALAHGVNLSGWWEGDQRQALTADDIKTLRKLGFDFVRLPVSPKWLMLEDAGEQKEKLAALRCDVIALLNENLSVIVDLHAMGRFQRGLGDNADEASARLADVWKTLQPVLGDLPPRRVYIGLFNEPHFDTDRWWEIQDKFVAALRPIFPHNTFVAAAGPDDGPWDLEKTEPYDDKNVIYDFHFYQPMYFTHHGAEWLDTTEDSDKETRPIYPVTGGAADEEGRMKEYRAEGWNREKLAGFIDKIAGWAKHYHVRVACLEFGVYRPYNDPASRAGWIGDMRGLLDDNKIPWALWEYRGSFGLLNDDGTPDDSLVKALGLNHSPAP